MADGNVCHSIFVVDRDVDLPLSPFEYAALTSFRDDAVGPGIQTVRVMPWKGVDADCVWIDPAFACVRDGLFPPGLDSGSPALKHLRPE